MKTLITILSSLFMASAFAAVNPGTTSTESSSGNLTVQISVGTVMQITGVNDVNIETWDGSNALPPITQNLCVFSNLSTQGNPYSLQIQDASNSNFKLVGTRGGSIRYTMTYNGSPLTPAGNSVTVSNQTGSSSPNCVDSPNGSNAQLVISVPPAANLSADTYSGTLNLIVSYSTT